MNSSRSRAELALLFVLLWAPGPAAAQDGGTQPPEGPPAATTEGEPPADEGAETPAQNGGEPSAEKNVEPPADKTGEAPQEGAHPPPRNGTEPPANKGAQPPPTGSAQPAPQPPPKAAPRVEILEEITVKGKKDVRVETVEGREVRERPATDLGQTLADQGISSVVRRGAIASDVVLRWFQRDNVTLTIDGALVQGACPNRMDPPSFHIDYAEVDRVDVRKGPFDVTVPGGIGGTVHVNVRSPHPGWNAEVNLSGSSNRHLEASGVLGYGGRWGDILGGYAFKYGMPYLTGDGIPFTAIYPMMSPNRYRDTSGTATAYMMHTAWAQAGHSFLGKRDRLQVAYTFQGANSVLYPYLLMDAIFDNTHRVNASYRVKDVGPFRELFAQVYFNTVDHLMNDERRCSSAATPGNCGGVLPRSYSMETSALSRMLGARVEAALLDGGPFRIGLDFYRREWDATTTRLNRMSGQYMAQSSVPNVEILDAGAYARYVRNLPRGFRISAGARLDLAYSGPRLDSLPMAQAATVEKLYENAWGGPQPLSATDVLGSANLEVDWRVVDAFTIYLGAGHGARTPDPQERYFALSGSAATAMAPARPGRVGNPTIAPPRNTEVDLGVKLSTRRFLARAEAFGSYVMDAIVVAPIVGTDGIPSVTSRNVTAYLAGAELTARLALPFDLYLGTAMSYTHGWNATSGGALQETPPFGGNVSLRWDIDWLFVEAQEQFAAAQERVDAAVGEQSTPGWAVTNIGVGGAYKGFKMMASARNIFNRTYIQHLNYLRDPFASGVRVAEPGWSIFLSLQYVRN